MTGVSPKNSDKCWCCVLNLLSASVCSRVWRPVVGLRRSSQAGMDVLFMCISVGHTCMLMWVYNRECHPYPFPLRQGLSLT